MRWMSALGLAIVVACAIGPVEAESRSEAQISPPVWPTLSRFRDDADLQRYLRDVRAATERAQAPAKISKQDDTCPPELYPCEEEEDEEEIVVTGSRIAQPAFTSSSPVATVNATSITNVQNLGVDEGDIVKFYGRFLIVLQDGRLFTADIGRRAGEMRLIDRADVYRNAGDETWYDEMLIAGNRIVATGYNYGENATEFSVFLISDSGRLTREAVYFLSSDDYYDDENYATRLVNGNLVIYTPLFLRNIYEGDELRWPIVRRWLRGGSERDTRTTRGRNLFDANDIYRPIQATYQPVVHTMSVCPLGSERAGDELECDSTAVVGPPGREFYVSTEHIYLWTYPTYDYELRGRTSCGANAAETGAAPSAIFQIPLNGGAPRALFVRGSPSDQLSMDANARDFRALDVWVDWRCRQRYNNSEEPLPLRYLSTPLTAFSTTPRVAPDASYTPIPSVGRGIENRFTETHLVYAGRDRYSSRAPEPNSDTIQSTRLAVVPTATPRAASVLDIGHNALRVERVGNNAIVTGYRDWRGLSLSMIELGARPRVSSTAFLEGRYETENRSHAFNAAVDPDGRGIMGLPTQVRRAESNRWFWRSESSDVSFLGLNNGQLSSFGAIGGASPKTPDYECEVSCIDWYGNTRAIFIAGRIFALSGTELVEGGVVDGRIRDQQRLNLTGQPQAWTNRRVAAGSP